MSADFLLLGVSDPIAVLPDVLLNDLAGEHAANPLDTEKPTALLRKLSRENGIDFISLVPAFIDRIGDSETALERYYLRCDGHWTSAGSQLAAEVAIPHLATQIAKVGG